MTYADPRVQYIGATEAGTEDEQAGGFRAQQSEAAEESVSSSSDQMLFD